MKINKIHRISPAQCGIALIEGYQHFISPLLKRHCIYIPTCSEYARQALIRYGFRKGLWLTLKRLARCHPFAQGGYDPLP